MLSSLEDKLNSDTNSSVNVSEAVNVIVIERGEKIERNKVHYIQKK